MCAQSIKEFFAKVFQKSKSKDRELYDPTQGQAHNASVRDVQYTEVIHDYVVHQRRINKAQRWFKAIFFVMVCSAFLAIIAVCLFAMVAIARKSNVSWEDFAVALTSVVSLISVVNVLPGKIAEHLFPTGGDKDITDFIIKMHENDLRQIKENWKVNQEDFEQEED